MKTNSDQHDHSDLLETVRDRQLDKATPTLSDENRALLLKAAALRRQARITNNNSSNNTTTNYQALLAALLEKRATTSNSLKGARVAGNAVNGHVAFNKLSTSTGESTFSSCTQPDLYGQGESYVDEYTKAVGNCMASIQNSAPKRQSQQQWPRTKPVHMVSEQFMHLGNDDDGNGDMDFNSSQGAGVETSSRFMSLPRNRHKPMSFRSKVTCKAQ